MNSTTTLMPDKLGNNTAESIEKILSENLANADAGKISDYRKTIEAAQPYQFFFEKLLAPIESPEGFCQRHLKTALQNSHTPPLDVHDSLILKPENVSDTVMQAYTLLQAAMLNFTDSEIRPHYFSADSEIVPVAQGGSVAGSTNAMTVEQFVDLSRRLDLGRQYQLHISRTFNAASVRLNAVRLAKFNMKLAAYTKYFSNDIHQTLWFMLTNLTRGTEDIANGETFQNAPLLLYSVQLFGKYLVDAVLITCRLTPQSTQNRYLLYVPNDTGSTFYQSPDEDNCRINLAANLLGDSSLRKLFASRLNKTDQLTFSTTHLSDISFKDDISFQPLTQKLFEYIASRALETFLADARQCAVPVSEINMPIHTARRETAELLRRQTLSGTLTHDFSKRVRSYATDALLNEVSSDVENWPSGKKVKALCQLLELKEQSLMGHSTESNPVL